MNGVATNTDTGGANGWSIEDRVTRLRVWGGDTVYPVPLRGRAIVGSAADCDIRLHDPAGRISRQHAELIADDDKLEIRDLESTNGIRHDGELRLAFHVTPAAEIEIAGVRLIAESSRSIALHALLGRVLGWGAHRHADVDAALRAVRWMATLRAPILLRGPGSMARIARWIHAHALDRLAFADTSSADDDPEQVLRDGGMVFLDLERPKVDVRMLVAGIRVPGVRVRTIVAAASPKTAAEAGTLFPGIVPVSVPPLSARAAELCRLLDELAAEPVARWQLPGSGLQPADLERIAALEIESLGELADLVERVVSFRNGGVTIGAERLGITHVTLGRWARSRRIPI